MTPIETAEKPADEPSLDLLAIARKGAADEGYSLNEALWLSVRAMLERAAAGDVQAFRAIADRFGGTPVSGTSLRDLVEASYRVTVVSGVPVSEIDTEGNNGDQS
tara:strand:- start:3181 stop:3495 length:315 start_codon:yes stop_codon:yes gene_type:complete